jgi:hypothetical protein
MVHGGLERFQKYMVACLDVPLQYLPGETDKNQEIL